MSWILRVTGDGAPPLSIYPCPYGSGFHVTSQQWRKKGK